MTEEYRIRMSEFLYKHIFSKWYRKASAYSHLEDELRKRELMIQQAAGVLLPLLKIDENNEIYWEVLGKLGWIRIITPERFKVSLKPIQERL